MEGPPPMPIWTRVALASCGGLVAALPGAYALALLGSAAAVRLPPGGDASVLLALWLLAALALGRAGTLDATVRRVSGLSALVHLGLPGLQFWLAGAARWSEPSLTVNLGSALCGASWLGFYGFWVRRAGRRLRT